MPARSTTFKLTHSNKKILANLWSSSTLTAWCQDLDHSQINLMLASHETAHKKFKWRLSIRLKTALTALKAASTWKTSEKSHTSFKIHWQVSQQSPSANLTTRTFRKWPWPTSQRLFVKIFPNRSLQSAALIHQLQSFPAAWLLPSRHFLPPSFACSNHASLPAFGK